MRAFLVFIVFVRRSIKMKARINSFLYNLFSKLELYVDKINIQFVRLNYKIREQRFKYKLKLLNKGDIV